MTAAAGPASRQAQGLSVTMIMLMAVELVALYSQAPLADNLARGLVLIIPIIGLSLLRAREFYLFAVALALTFIALVEGPLETQAYLKALDRAGFLASFILLMGLLREGAITSPAVGTCGTYVTHQPSRRRFVAIFAGSHFLSVLINLGALNLLAPIIQRGVRAGRALDAPLDEIGAVRERRQLCAALRGFSWILVWAPTAVTQAALFVLMPGIDGLRLAGLGLLMTLIMLLVSWAEDIARWRPFRRALIARGALPKPTPMAFPLAAFCRLGLICALLFGLAVGFKTLGSVSIVAGVMATAPIVVGLWVLAQQAGLGPTRALAQSGERLQQILATLPGGVRETCTLAAAGYIGTLAAALVPVENLAWLDPSWLPTWLFMSFLSVFVWLGGQVALSPITSAVFLGSLMTDLPAGLIDPTLAALAIAAGTAICTTGAPFASGTLVMARATGYSGATLTWKWNGLYTALATAVLVVIYAVLTGGT